MHMTGVLGLGVELWFQTYPSIFFTLLISLLNSAYHRPSSIPVLLTHVINDLLTYSYVRQGTERNKVAVVVVSPVFF